MTKEPARRGFPGPPKIENHLAQGFEFGRQIRDDVVSPNVRHDVNQLVLKKAKVGSKNNSSKRSL